MKNWLLILLIPSAIAFSKQKVEFYSNFPVSCKSLTHLIKEHNLEVVEGNYERFQKGKGIKKYLVPKEDKDRNLAKVVFWNLSSKDCKLALKRMPKEKMVLFMWEPPTVLPKMYQKKLHAHFGRVYTWDDELVDNIHYFKFFYPELKPMLEKLPSFEEKKLLTMVVGNHSSQHPNELYSTRKAIIDYFEKNPSEDFEFYGRGWSHELKNYRGSCEDKLETIKHYKFSICFENIEGFKGYITEKIFDCLAAGSVPIYWGASNVTDYIPASCFIDMRDFSSFKQLHEFLGQMPEETYTRYLEEIKAFLCSEKAQQFSPRNFQKIFTEAVLPQKS